MYEWSIPVIENAIKQGINIVCVDGIKVVRSEIVSRVNKLNPTFIFLNGHGDSNAFYGYEDKIVINIDNASMFKNKIVFSRACDCARFLGKKAVEEYKCTSFIGYNFEFINVRQTNVELKPREDKISKPIWEVSNTIPLSLIKGTTVAVAVESSHKKATKMLSKLLFSKEPGTLAVMKAIIANDDCLIYHGNGYAKI